MEKVNKKTLGQLLHRNRVNKINMAYAQYRLDPTENALNDLLKEVIKLGRRKLRPQAAALGDVGYEDDDDFSQKVVMTVWGKIGEFNREPQAFYPWLMTIINNHRMDLFDHLSLWGENNTPLMLQDEEGDEYENPEIYAGHEGVSVDRRAPAGLEEDEIAIYYMTLDGDTQERIAGELGVGHATLERRIRELKDRYAEEKSA